jgi:hypothetical protein
VPEDKGPAGIKGLGRGCEAMPKSSAWHCRVDDAAIVRVQAVFVRASGRLGGFGCNCVTGSA